MWTNTSVKQRSRFSRLLSSFDLGEIPGTFYAVPVTVLESIQKSAAFLARKGVDSPRLQAELLLADVIKLPRMKLYLNFERALSEIETKTFRDLVQRRGN